MILLALALIYTGFTALSLAMDRHHRQVFGRDPRTRVSTLLRVLGFALLAAALAPCVAVWGASVGFVAWLGLLTAAALLLILLLTYAPVAAAALAMSAPILAMLAAAVGLYR